MHISIRRLLFVFTIVTVTLYGQAQSFKKDIQISVWFNEQLIPWESSYTIETDRFGNKPRTSLRKENIAKLKEISAASQKKANPEIQELISLGLIKNFRQHWIFNGFTCTISDGSTLDSLKKIKSIARIIAGPPPFATVPGTKTGKGFVRPRSKSKIQFDLMKTIWSYKKLGVDRVWNELGISGENILNVVHDFGFVLDVPGTKETLFVNKGERPNNGIDDDKNGYIDDYHGFNFSNKNSHVNNVSFIGTNLTHGNICAMIISGRISQDKTTILGIAPNSRWSPVVGINNIEESIEWALEQGADTYSMSFSIPNLSEYRSHWRRVMEHGALCGLFFVSGAGNFGNPSNPNYALVPIQMRTPEDIPEAVFGISGVDSTLTRPKFSSQGPVLWKNELFDEGLTQKPDFTTINGHIVALKIDGSIAPYFLQGNSFAGPHFAGIIALMLSANPELTPWKAKEILIETAQDLGPSGHDYQYGKGLIDAYKAVSMALKIKNEK